MGASLRFYRDVLGFEVVESAPMDGDACDWALLRLDEAEIMLNTAYEAAECPPVPDAARAAGHGDTTLFFLCPDVDAACALLRARGVELDAPAVRDYGMKQLMLRDPDGYGLCFQWPVAVPDSEASAEDEL